MIRDYPTTPQQRVDGLMTAINMGQFSPSVAEATLKQLAADPETRDLKPCPLHPESWPKRKRNHG